LAITREILRSYRAPRAAFRAQLAAGRREDRAVAYLLGACLVVFIGQWPRLRREALTNPEGPPFDALVAGALFGWLFLMPLLLYGLAALSHLAARAFGGQGTWYRARLALFWALLVASPLMLLYGLVAGIIGPSIQLTLTGAVTGLAFLVHWGISLAEAEKPPSAREA